MSKINLKNVPNFGTVQIEFYNEKKQNSLSMLQSMFKMQKVIFEGFITDCDFYPEKINVLNVSKRNCVKIIQL